ncbi:dihydropteroate synthase [Chitinophaga sp. SYP-B3965]|uniref:dihydropteroate synthase n=1 Tax=Chitinophaga sp. SYP-B3965 TaxID=2663120 RepID=UPI001299AAFF|nr:dihydropteroate synthase [Chitinophaga sp. SYP-B3965]MRG44464.1 dihydropteroate synthase [Chitinophaga sp. SYP-B3965]
MSFKNTLLRKDFTIRCKGKLINLSRPAVMGIINVTDDSFYADSRTRELHHIIDRAGDMLEEGALMLDIGAQSTRPGAPEVGAATEQERLLPAIHGILHHFPEAILSIDTYHASVAEKCIQAGAAIINDVSSGDMDPLMLETVAKLQVPYIAMHMQGTPADMQQNPEYNNVSQEVLDYFIQKVAKCREAGITDVIIDPGFGFGKTLEHNYQLLKNLDVFEMLETPILIGVSRKSMIYRLLGNSASEALNGTTVVQTLALQKGAAILRVHDVKEAVEATRIVSFLKSI